MSLIYKQKVACMFNDLLSVYTRMSAPHVSLQSYDSTTSSSLAAKKNSNRQYMSDDAKFNIAEDFAPDFNLEPFEAMDTVLQIMHQDNLLNNIDPASIPLAEEADARDRLFEKFMDKSYASIHMEPDEGYVVDFEFDKNGDIIVLGNVNREAVTPGDLLEHTDFDQELRAIGGTTDDLTKTHNSGSNDPHFSTTANITTAADTTGTHKKRKVRFIKDDNLYCEYRKKRLRSTSHRLFLPDLVEGLSQKSPHFVNYCYKAVFGPQITSGIPRNRYPLADRHPRAAPSTLHELFHDLVEIEEGRNIRAPNVSFDNMDTVLRHNISPDDEQFFQDIDFDVDLNLSMDNSLEEIWQDNDESPYAQMLSKFHSFVMTKLEQENQDKITFEQLVPSTATVDERPVNRKFAAPAFATLLQLATLGQLHLDTADSTESPLMNKIYISKAV